MTGFTENRNGRYKCDFCDHPAYKRLGDVGLHLQAKHSKEFTEALASEVAELQSSLLKAKNQPPKIVEKVVTKERVVYKDKPEPKYWYVRNYGMEGIYCTTCKQVQTGVGIPVGQTIENTPHSCGNRTLLPVVEVR